MIMPCPHQLGKLCIKGAKAVKKKSAKAAWTRGFDKRITKGGQNLEVCSLMAAIVGDDEPGENGGGI